MTTYDTRRGNIVGDPKASFVRKTRISVEIDETDFFVKVTYGGDWVILENLLNILTDTPMIV
jgi:hypothetical protein